MNKLRKIFLTALAAFAIIISAYSVNAAVESYKNSSVIQYIGEDEKSIMFEINYTNPDAQKLVLNIKNDDGVIVYEKIFNRSDLSMKLRLVKGDLDNMDELNPTITLSDERKTISQTFNIKPVSYMVNDFEVKRVK